MSLYPYNYKLQDHILTSSHRHSDLNDFGVPDIHSSNLNAVSAVPHGLLKTAVYLVFGHVSNSLEQLKRLSAKTKMLQYSMQETYRKSAGYKSSPCHYNTQY